MYIDDIIVTSNSPTHVDQFIHSLVQHFSLKDLGPLSYFLGVEATPVDKGLFLFQKKYICDLLAKTNMLDVNPISSPSSTSKTLKLNDSSPLTDATQYRQVLGSMQYLALTRPDVSFPVISFPSLCIVPHHYIGLL